MAGAMEREVKLGAWAGFTFPDLTHVLPGATTTSLAALRLEATYYDTVDLRLARSGASLRFRSEVERAPQDGHAGTAPEPPWTLKLALTDAGPGLARQEIGFGGADRRVPAAARSLVMGITRGVDLVPVARLRTDRSRIRVLDASGAVLAEIDDDEVSVLIPGPSGRRRVASRFRELEVELAHDADPLILDAIVGVLRSVGAGSPDPTPKVVRALGPRAQGAPDVVVPEVDRDATVADAITAAVAASVAALIHHDPGVRLGDDPEAVHKARVATRRLRSDLRTFRALLDAAWVEELRRELGWVAARLGAVRDTDVLLERLAARVETLPTSDQDPAAALLAGLGRQRDVARSDLMAGLQSTRYTDLLERLVLASRNPAFATTVPVGDGSSPDPGSPARDTLPGLVLRPWRHLANAVAALGKAPSDDELHELRIRAKRCRYAAEAVAPVVGKRARLFAAATAEVQGVLGDFHDAVVASAWLRETGRSVPGEVALVAGQLLAAEEQAAADGRRAWTAAWKSASSRKLRSWIP
ncbi:MAG: CYTH and CHAD domain-containing protein [Acidimicrobiales bacterium]